MVAKNRGRRTYRSMQGKVVDLDLLIKRNELTPAVGNAKVNARGDELGPGGKIIRKREDVVSEYYGNQPVAHESNKSTKETNLTPEEKNELAEFDEEPVPPKPTPKKVEPVEPKAQPKKVTAQPKTESKPQDEWIEDEDGNFIRKGD